MKILILILKIWVIGFIIFLPIVLSFLKSAKSGDKLNSLADTEER